MREIGTVAKEKDARTLADYLLTLEITTKLDPRADGSWAVWVHREDRVPEARGVLDAFNADPTDDRYRSAADAARALRKNDEKAEADYRKRHRDLRDRWEGPLRRRAPLTFGLLVASIAVTALMHAPLDVEVPVFYRLSFSIQTVDFEGFPHDSGFEQIAEGQVWRLVTPIFLHFTLLHLFFNMMALLAFGTRIEMRKGTWRLLLIVLVAAVAGNVGQYFHKGGGFGGMSGVVFALGGYLWIKGQADPEDGLALDGRSAFYLVAWFVFGVMMSQNAPPGARGFPYNMANVTHGVGLAVGMAFGLLRF